MKKTLSRNFHLPLPDYLYLRLRDEAERSKQPATRLARQALEEWLIQREKAALYTAIADYASLNAGGEQDLDLDLEATTIDHLLTSETTDS